MKTMKPIKHFTRSIRQEIHRISTTIKQMEFQVMGLRGYLKRKLRTEIQKLRRMRDAILHKLSKLKAEADIPAHIMQSIRDEIALLNARCRQLRAQHL